MSASGAMRKVLRLFFAAHLFFPIVWLWSQATGSQLTLRDWYYIRLAGERFLDGDLPSIYSAVDDGFLWRYPPFALYLAALLAMLTPGAAYWLVVTTSLLALVVLLFLLRDSLQVPEFGLVALAVATSAAFTSVLVTGQNSALIGLTIAAAMWALHRGHTTLPYAALGLLALKPNWLPFFIVYAVSRRHIKGLIVMGSVGIGVLLAGLPIGLTGEFINRSLSNADLLADFPAYKSITIWSFFAAMTDSILPWVLVVVALTIGALIVWSERARIPLERHFAVLVLITIAANPYVAFYDGFVVAIPAVVWWASRDSYVSPTSWKTIGALVASIWLWDQAVFFYRDVAESLGVMAVGRPPVSLVGPMLVIWIGCEVFDAVRGTRIRGPNRAAKHPA